MVGLIIVLVNLTEKKIPLVVKCAGPCLVMIGLTAMLLRILFSYTPSFCKGCGNKKKKATVEKASDTIGNTNHGVELSNGQLCISDIAKESNNLRIRQSKRTTSSQPSGSLSNIASSDNDSFLSSIEFENVKIRKGRERRKAKNDEFVLDVSNIS